MQIRKIIYRLLICIMCIFCLHTVCFAAGNVPFGDIGEYGNWINENNVSQFNENLSGDVNSFQKQFQTNLSSSNFGSTLYPNFSNTLLVKIAVFTLLHTTLGAKNSPCNICLFIPKLGPTSFPSPGAVSLSAHSLIKSFLPATYAPFGAIPPPKFFIRDPTTISAPTSIGSFLFTNSQ